MRQRGIRLPFDLAGIPVLLDLSFLLVLPLFAYLIGSQVPGLVQVLVRVGVIAPDAAAAAGPALSSGATPWLLGLVAALGLFTSVVIHELGHAIVARLYGVQTVEIRLWFLGGVAQFKEIPRQRGAEAVVALAGPITSALLGGTLWLLVPLVDGSVGAQVVTAYLAVTNLALAVFNLLPALPLDGGRVLRSLLALAFDRVRATTIAATISAALAVLMGVYGFFTGQPFLVIMAFFVYNAGRAEASAAHLDDALGKLTVAQIMTPDPISVESDMPLSQFERLGEYRRHAGYPVVDGNEVRGYAFIANAHGANGGGTVADIVRPIDTIGPDAAALDAVHRVAESDTGRLLVVDADGALVGIVSKTDLVRVFTGAPPRA